jgi:UDP-N-acetylglucosamine 1-carboxyvinyltransferase
MSEALLISGQTKISGTVKVSGAKNAALPLLIASLLTDKPCIFHRVPSLEDVRYLLQLLEQLGATTDFKNNTASITASNLVSSEASYSLVKALRASFWVLAPLLARTGVARVALPGGDAIGARPVDIHLDALKQMGATIELKAGIVTATAPKSGLKPANIKFRFPSVGATHQILMAASLVPGVTTIEGAAKEPEVIAVAECLNQMGANIQGAGGSLITIEGTKNLSGTELSVIGDRIEAGTYLLAAAATGGQLVLDGIDPLYFGSFLDIVHQLGVEISSSGTSVSVKAPNKLKSVNVITAPFPDFATDLQAPLMAALSVANGTSTIQETMFEGRFGHVSELCRMGANIKISEHTAIIEGVNKLSAAPVDGLDIRAAACLVIAGILAEGTTVITDISHLRRGYENFISKFKSIGANMFIQVKDPDDFMFSGC